MTRALRWMLYRRESLTSGSKRIGPDEAYLRLLRGKIGGEQYGEALLRSVREKRQRPSVEQPRALTRLFLYLKERLR